MSASLPVETVADTAFITAYARAVESERSDRLFNDPFAARLAGDRGRSAMERLPTPDSTAAGCIMRTAILDDLILEQLSHFGITTIVNLGAGLDTRPYRLPLSPKLTWIEVDAAPVLEHKERELRKFRPRCQLQTVKADLFSDDLKSKVLEGLAKDKSKVLIVSEGVLTYFRPEQVRTLARELNACASIDAWLTDFVSAAAMASMQQSHSSVQSPANVRLVFAPPEGPSFFRPLGWAPVRYRSCVEEGRARQRFLVTEKVLSGLLEGSLRCVYRMYGILLLSRTAITEPDPVTS